MTRTIQFPAPELQMDFAFALKRFRGTYLQDALFKTIATLKIAHLDRQLAEYVRDEDLRVMAQYGLRGELVFAVPLVLEANPFLVGYYRLLLGYSQKEFYGRDKGFDAAMFKNMETHGRTSKAAESGIPILCKAFCNAASTLLHGIEPLMPSKDLFDDLTLLTVGPQLRGGANNQRGTAGIVQVFEVMRNIVAHATTEIKDNSMEIESAAGRKVLVEFASDPDIIIREEMSSEHFRNIVAVEIKSGTDVSNIHNRIGEAEKSHQKARRKGYTECWTVVNVARLDLTKAKAESPSTDRFYSLHNLIDGQGEEYDDFKRRIVSLTGIALR